MELRFFRTDQGFAQNIEEVLARCCDQEGDAPAWVRFTYSGTAFFGKAIRPFWPEGSLQPDPCQIEFADFDENTRLLDTEEIDALHVCF